MKPETMVARVEAYLRARRALGFDLAIVGSELLRFARFADASGHRGAVTADLAMRWARAATTATRQYQARRLADVRCFAKYQLALEPDTEIPQGGVLGPARRRSQPYIFETAEITALMSTASRLSSPRRLRGVTYATLIGLLACTGVRISEALRLRRTDADLEAGVLSIRQTKFKKSRLVPLHRSALAALRCYVARRDAMVPSVVGATLFVSEAGRALPYRTVHAVCRKLIDEVVPVDATVHRRPRIHDVRHTFACRCLLRWYRDGADVDQRVAALSTYLGHAKVSDTYWYLTGIPELMAIAAARFERFGRRGAP